MREFRKRRVIRPKRVKPKRRVHKKKTGERNSAPPFPYQLDQTQVIRPLAMVQTFADCEWLAWALHEGGGPGTSVTTTVTFCDGLKP